MAHTGIGMKIYMLLVVRMTRTDVRHLINIAPGVRPRMARTLGKLRAGLGEGSYLTHCRGQPVD